MPTRTLVTAQGVRDHPDDAVILSAFRACETAGFWLDIAAPDSADYELLERGLGFHALTIEDIRQRNQRPTFEDFERYSFAILFGARCDHHGLTFVEYGLYAAPHYCVSVHHEPSQALETFLDRFRQHGQAPGDHDAPPMYSYLVMDQVVDGMFEVLDAIDGEVDDLMDAIIAGRTGSTLVEITKLKRRVSELRRVLGAQQDLFQRLVTHVVSAGKRDVAPYYRDVYDHVIRQYDMVDSLRDLLSSAMDVHLSSVSNRLNSTVKALTVIASLFLPLTFLTGFFGMNFAALVDTIKEPWTFAAALGVMGVSVVVQLALFRRRGWI